MSQSEMVRVTGLLLTISFLLMLATSSTWAVPLEGIPLDGMGDWGEDVELDSEKRSMLLSKLLEGHRPVRHLDQASFGDMVPRETRAFAPKRRLPYQTRSNGLSLCLWKVCPAAPWLVTKRRV